MLKSLCEIVVREVIVNVSVDSTGLWEKRSSELGEVCDEEMLLKNNLESCPTRSRMLI